MSIYTDQITGISHDFSAPLSAGKGMWFCTVHGKECSPYGPGDPKAIADYLLAKAANDTALPDGAFGQVARAVEPEDWDCGSGQCDPNTGCPACSDEDRPWVARS